MSQNLYVNFSDTVLNVHNLSTNTIISTINASGGRNFTCATITIDKVLIGYNQGDIEIRDVNTLTIIVSGSSLCGVISFSPKVPYAPNTNYFYIKYGDNYLRKYSITDLSLLAESSVLTGKPFRYVEKDNYIYVSTDVTGTDKIYKLLKNDLSIVESINSMSDVLDLDVDDTYLYVGGILSVGKVYKYALSDLSTIVDTITLSYPVDEVRSIVVDDNYIYVKSNGTSEAGGRCIRKYNKNDFSYVTISSTIGTVATYDGIYISQDNSEISTTFDSLPKLYRFSTSDLSTISNTGNLLARRTFVSYPPQFPDAPTNFSATTITYTGASFTWTNNSQLGNNVIQKYNNGIWQNVTTLPLSASTYNLTGLLPSTSYTYRVSIYYNGIYYPSNNYSFNTLDFLPSFCAYPDYSISGSTCNNSNGIITINNSDYFIFYDFNLNDYDGNNYSITNNYFSGLTANYYTLTITPKLIWKYHYGKNPCTIDWIPIEDTNTTISLTGDTKIKNANCTSFGNSKGRIVWTIVDNTGTSWTLDVYNTRYEHVFSQVFNTTTLYYNCLSDDYYAVVTNNNGCHLLIGLTQVGTETSYTVEGIQKVYLTPWNINIGYNYYSNSDEDYYVSGLDTQFFTSTKIKEFIGITDYWYQIILNTAIMRYNQSLQKNQNGLTFTEEISITIPYPDNQKWQELTNILTERYIIIFQDNNNNYWTCGYKNGMEVKSYARSNNEYIISFQHPSVSKILTAMDDSYVKLHVQ